MLKDSDESWFDYFWRVADIVVLGAGVSTVVWCGVWIVGFITLTLLSVLKGIPTSTTAFVLTLTVLLGHLPKIFAIFLGTDTDFQNFKSTFSNFSLRNAPWYRVIIASFLTYYLILSLMDQVIVAEMIKPLEPTDISGFVSQTWKFIHFCLILFLIQFVFSFPNEVTRVKGRQIGGGNG